MQTSGKCGQHGRDVVTGHCRMVAVQDSTFAHFMPQIHIERRFDFFPTV